MREFETGATRDSEDGKHDPEGFFSPLAMEAFMEYMTSHRVQADGSVRDSDNWQKGMSLIVYMKSMWRHFFDVWKLHRGIPVYDKKTGRAITPREALCALLFNVQGYLHETVKAETPPNMKSLYDQYDQQQAGMQQAKREKFVGGIGSGILRELL